MTPMRDPVDTAERPSSSYGGEAQLDAGSTCRGGFATQDWIDSLCSGKAIRERQVVGMAATEINDGVSRGRQAAGRICLSDRCLVSTADTSPATVNAHNLLKL